MLDVPDFLFRLTDETKFIRLRMIFSCSPDCNCALVTKYAIICPITDYSVKGNNKKC